MLYHRESGRGPALVMLHGLFGSLENLGALARDFSAHYHVYSLDLSNHGRSPHSETMSLASMVADLAQWFEAQNLESAVFLGHSLGGKVMMEFALSYPEKVEALVVIDIAPIQYEPHHTAVLAGLKAIEPSSLSHRSEADKILSAYIPELPVRSFLLKNLVKSEHGFRWRMNLHVIEKNYPALIQENRRGNFAKPVLFVKGEKSDYINEEYREAIVSRFPKVELKVIADTAHWLHAEKPELVAKVILKFLSVKTNEH